MNTRSGRATQAGAKGRSAPSLTPRENNRKQSKGGGKGAGVVASVTPDQGGSSLAAAILPGAGRLDEIPATVQSHQQMVLYDHDEEDLWAVQCTNLSGNGSQVMYRVSLTIPKYAPKMVKMMNGRDIPNS